MSTKSVFISLFLLLGFIELKGQTFSQINYPEDTTNFANPERGFYHADPNVDYENLRAYRQAGITKSSVCSTTRPRNNHCRSHSGAGLRCLRR